MTLTTIEKNQIILDCLYSYGYLDEYIDLLASWTDILSYMYFQQSVIGRFFEEGKSILSCLAQRYPNQYAQVVQKLIKGFTHHELIQFITHTNENFQFQFNVLAIRAPEQCAKIIQQLIRKLTHQELFQLLILQTEDRASLLMILAGTNPNQCAQIIQQLFEKLTHQKLIQLLSLKDENDQSPLMRLAETNSDQCFQVIQQSIEKLTHQELFQLLDPQFDRYGNTLTFLIYKNPEKYVQIIQQLLEKLTQQELIQLLSPQSERQLSPLIILAKKDRVKKHSSRAAMQITQQHPAYQAWPQQVSLDLASMLKALNNQDFELLGRTAQSNAQAMHDLIETANGFSYSTSKTKALKNQVKLMQIKGHAIYFTQDAGPNLKLLFEADQIELVQNTFNDVIIVQPFKQD